MPLTSINIEYLKMEGVPINYQSLTNDQTNGNRDITSTNSDSEASTLIPTPLADNTHQTLQIIDLPKEVLKTILGYIFPVNTIVIPWFSCGMTTLYIRGHSLNDEAITFNPNLDAAFLRASKACHSIGTTLLYSTNHFEFRQRSDLAKWWMMKIGDANVRKIKSMRFVLTTGWHYDRRYNRETNPSEMSHEEHWYTALTYLQPRIGKLDYLHITTDRWKSLRFEYKYIPNDAYELGKYRKLIFDRLSKYRGVKKAVIEQWGWQYFGTSATTLELMMQQPLQEETRIEPPVRMSLEEIIQQCKEEYEEMVRRVRLGG